VRSGGGVGGGVGVGELSLTFLCRHVGVSVCRCVGVKVDEEERMRKVANDFLYPRRVAFHFFSWAKGEKKGHAKRQRWKFTGELLLPKGDQHSWAPSKGIHIRSPKERTPFK